MDTIENFLRFRYLFHQTNFRFDHFLIYGGSCERWDKWWEFFEVKEKYSSVQVLYPSCKAHRVTTLGHPYQMRRRGEGWNITVQPCLVTGLAPAWWNGADQPLHYVLVHFHARHWTPTPCCCWNWDPPFLCVLVEPSKNKKQSMCIKPFSTCSSSLQPKGDVVKTLFLNLFIPIAFGDPCFDTNECPTTYAWFIRWSLVYAPSAEQHFYIYIHAQWYIYWWKQNRAKDFCKRAVCTGLHPRHNPYPPYNLTPINILSVYLYVFTITSLSWRPKRAMPTAEVGRLSNTT